MAAGGVSALPYPPQNSPDRGPASRCQQTFVDTYSKAVTERTSSRLRRQTLLTCTLTAAQQLLPLFEQHEV